MSETRNLSLKGTHQKARGMYVTHAELLKVIELVQRLAAASLEEPEVLESVLEAAKLLEADHAA